MTLSSIVRAERGRANGPRLAVLVASGSLLLGLAIVGMRPADPKDTSVVDVGMVVVLLALVLLIGAIHTYGRLGPDEGETSARSK